MFTTLQTRLSLLFLAFLVLVAASVAITQVAIQSQRYDALLINLAGRQRMLSQQMIWLALTAPESSALTNARQRFDRTFAALINGGTTLDTSGHTITLPLPQDPASLPNLTKARQTWQNFAAQLDAYVAAPNAAAQPGLVDASLTLLDALDSAVAQLGEQAQAKVQRLRIIQISFLCSALLLLAVSYWLTRRRVVAPLVSLSDSAQRMATGDLEQRLPSFSQAEMRQLATTLDAIRMELSSGRRQLEERVNQRTQELTTAFEFSQEIAAQLELNRLLDSVTDRARTLMAGRAAALCLLEDEGTALRLAAGSGAGYANMELRQPVDTLLPGMVVGQGRTVTTATTCASCGFLHSLDAGQCIATPLRAGNATLGALCVTRPDKATFTPEEQTALSLLANAAAGAILNAQLVETSNRQSREAAAQAERERLAADLHDNLAQTLGFLNLKAERIEGLIAAGDAEAATRELAQMRGATGRAYGQVRAALTGLRASAVAPRLVEDLQACVEEMNGLTGLPIQLQVEAPQPLVLTPLAQQQALHIVREALTNAWRHAQPTQVTVSVNRVNRAICIEVCDDGCGFDPRAVDERTHLGLAIMRARAERSGGRLTIHSRPGAGAQVCVVFATFDGSETG